uniref:Glycosyl transferase family 25 domain-containing protein n=1 Tax=viral metagenome TaxID=1070528 RepID=A0A6C0D8Z2_9ZZZZ
MSYLNNIVDKVYVINLDKDKERLESITNQLTEQNIVFERFSAIDGSKIQNNSQFTEFCNNFCTNGTKGCALSHRSLHESIINNNYESICIFEDDVIFNKDFNDHLQLLFGSIPSDYDIVYLGNHFYCGDTSTYNQFTTKLFNVKTSEYSTGVLKVAGCGGFHGYIISKQGAQKILNSKTNFHIDIDIMQLNLNAYAFHPVLVESGDNKSNLSSDFPPLLSSFISKIPVTNQNNHKSLNFIFSENLIQIGSLQINAFMVAILIIGLLFPINYYYIVYIWLLIEFLCSFDTTNTIIYFNLISVPFVIKYILLRSR